MVWVFKLLLMRGKENYLFLKRKTSRILQSGIFETESDRKNRKWLDISSSRNKNKSGHEYFHYKDAYILKEIDPTKFLAHSKYDIRLGVYHSGIKAGQPHDHGSAFRLTEKFLPLLFKIHKKIL